MGKEKLLALAGVGLDETERLSREMGRPIDVDRSALVMLARIAMHQPDGEDYMRSHVRSLVEDMVRRFPTARRTSTSTSPQTPTSGGRRGSSTPACPFCKPLTRLTVGEETGVDRRVGMCYHEALSRYARNNLIRITTSISRFFECG